MTGLTIAALLLRLLGLTQPAADQSLPVEVTAYCLKGRTSSGRATGPGVLAVDPAIIPLGSRVYVPGYGWGTAADTCPRAGVVDVWLPDQDRCLVWGSRRLTVKVQKQK
ncbi:3D domain-containing protein [bacterium]|nr:3D domain-containing protein [bacterium]